MWPWGHLAVAYLCYVALLRLDVRGRGKQTASTLIAVAVGSQFPDLVDKPLAWSFALLPSGRSLAHSLLTAAIVLTLLYRVSRRLDREPIVVAFGTGWIAHSLSDLGPDVILGLLSGDASQLQWTTYLLWPLFRAPPYPHDDSFIGHFTRIALDSYMGFQVALLGIAVAIWILAGTPGLRETYFWIRERYVA